MAAECRVRNSAGERRQNAPQPKGFDIPYFEHQQLDPRRFPLGVGAPLAESPAVENRKQVIADTVANDDDKDEDDAGIKYPGSDKDCKYLKSKSFGRKRRRSDARASEGINKRNRMQGFRSALAKKVTVELDSDDEMIVRMKEAKYGEKDIAKRLADEGRVNYNPKTIGTRWARLKKALAQHQEELLEADLTDWHDGDDEVLKEAIAKAEQEIDNSIKKIKQRKWHVVADYVKAMKPVTNFGQEACQRRFNDLRDGSAKPTPESIVDPDEKTLVRIQARRDKEAKIEEDRRTMPVFRACKEANLTGNASASQQGVS